MGSDSKKNQIACRVSRETYEKVKALTEGENPPFESVSEYLATLIAADLGRREVTVPDGAPQLLELLNDPAVRAEVKRLLQEGDHGPEDAR
jgi:hypothetical protein